MKIITYYHARNPSSFEERLEDILMSLEAKFRYSSQDFGINFSDGHTILLQVIRRGMLEKALDPEYGYGIHLCFDDAFPIDKERLKRFHESEIKTRFEYHIWEGIPCYQLDLRNDKAQLISISGTILELVYLKNLEDIEIEEFEM